jgi:cation transport protein ChaC
MRDLWVFGYGSLMWRPGFDFAERRRATLPGWRRRFCLKSIKYRGTPERPGLVLGLDADPAAECRGVAYRAAPEAAEAVHAYLRERELVTYAYLETTQEIALEEGRRVEALCFVIDRDHAQYAGPLTPEAQAAVIAAAAGPMGSNADYLESTVDHLAEIGVADPELDALRALVRARRAEAACPST